MQALDTAERERSIARADTPATLTADASTTPPPEAGFTLTHLEEWGPSDAQVEGDPSLAQERQRPTFMLFAAER